MRNWGRCCSTEKTMSYKLVKREQVNSVRNATRMKIASLYVQVKTISAWSLTENLYLHSQGSTKTGPQACEGIAKLAGYSTPTKYRPAEGAVTPPKARFF